MTDGVEAEARCQRTCSPIAGLNGADAEVSGLTPASVLVET